MELPVPLTLEPMLAKSVAEIPTGAGMTYEPKWDGFRCLVFRDGDEVELASRGGKTLTRYFPEVVGYARAQLPERCVVDAELVVVLRPDQQIGDDHPAHEVAAAPDRLIRFGRDGSQARLDFDTLSQRIHPAASRVRLLAEQVPASVVAFDLVAIGDESLLETPYRDRRARLAEILAGAQPPVYLTPVTADVETASRWFEMFEGAGLDGIIAKPADIPYAPGKRIMYKVKHVRTADVVVAGFRWHKTSTDDVPLVGSLLLGLYDDAGMLHHVGVCGSFAAPRRAELVGELAQYREDAAEGHPWLGEVHDGRQRVPGAVSRWTGKKDLSWEPLRPELVAEVAYEGMEGDRIRHTARLQRWRPDRTPQSCTYAQLERPVVFDVDQVLAGTPEGTP